MGVWEELLVAFANMRHLALRCAFVSRTNWEAALLWGAGGRGVGGLLDLHLLGVSCWVGGRLLCFGLACGYGIEVSHSILLQLIIKSMHCSGISARLDRPQKWEACKSRSHRRHIS